jgi:hypothetical protein
MATKGKPSKTTKRTKNALDLKYVPWTEAELDALSEVTPQDIEKAKAFVERAAPLAAKLLDAKLDEKEPNAGNSL